MTPYSGANTVSVSKVLDHYDPWIHIFQGVPSEADVRNSILVEGEDPKPPDDYDDNTYWHLGRVKFFLNLLESGGTVAPIDLDWRWSGMAPVELVLLDGHHRLCAAALAGVSTLQANYGGPVDFLEYLEGKRSACSCIDCN